MKRLFLLATVFVATLVALLCPSAVSASPSGDVSRISINYDSFTMDGCEGPDSILVFTFNSRGTGTVRITASNVSTTYGSLEQKVSGSLTTVRLPISDGYAGEAVVAVEGARWNVPNGQRGDQTARDQFTTTVGIANCAASAPNPQALESEQDTTSFWESHLKLILVIAVAVLGLGVVLTIVYRLS